MKDYTEQLLELSDHRVKLANKYALERKKYGELKAELDIFLAGKLISMMEKRKTLGYETATLLLISQQPELAETYKEMIKHFNNFKAMDRMLSAVESKAMCIQSILKYNKENDGGM